jgi:hypothetical protein
MDGLTRTAGGPEILKTKNKAASRDEVLNPAE